MLDSFGNQRRGNMRYLDLNYIEKVFLEEVKRAYFKIFDNEKTKGHSITADVFVQNWFNTATGFDLENSTSGQAFIQEYTTIMRLHWWELDEETGTFEPWNVLYGVFFGERPAYFCTNPTDEFEKDLKNRRMKSQKEAWVYGDESLNGEYDMNTVEYPFYKYICGVTGLTCCGCSLFCGHRREKNERRNKTNS